MPVVLPGIRIDLPKASSQKIELKKEEIILTVDKEGAFYCDSQLVDEDEVLQRLRAAFANNPDMLVLIKGDRSTHYGRVVDLLGRVRRSGLRRIAIITQEQRKPDTSGAPKVK